MIKLTLLVCTYNNADLLEDSLRAMGRQSEVPCDWEIVVVPNNCSDRTLAVCEEFQAAGHLPEMRVICESRQGVAFARKTGIIASRGEWIAFIDDDCRIAGDWVARAVEFIEAHPRAGVIGGRNILEWEIEPSDLHLAYEESFAGQDWGEETRRVGNQELPCGAGMLIRRSAVLQSGYLQSGCLIGRDPVHLGAGEDTEIALFIARCGWEVWYCANLQLQHFIPRERMGLYYMCRLHRGFGRAEAYLRCLASEPGLRFRNRVRQLPAAFKELAKLLCRFPLGFVWYRNERPTWTIRWYHSLGLIRGAIVNLCTGGRSHQEINRPRTDRHLSNRETDGIAESAGAVPELVDASNREAA